MAIVFLVGAAMMGAWRPRVITLFDRVSFGAVAGCVTLGVHRDLPEDWPSRVSRPIVPLGGFGEGVLGVFEYPVLADGSAWRPYHSAGWRAHHVIVPIWQPLALAMLGFGWSLGYLRGSRWRDPRLCLGCGHRVRVVAGVTECPECGLRQTTAEGPREPLAPTGSA
ncbi:MAG: hypothetical protein JNM94_06775 [Phycisphaerae bacterium]|nr:hypothetical protein [Phycisphaerae bacterium]